MQIACFFVCKYLQILNLKQLSCRLILHICSIIRIFIDYRYNVQIVLFLAHLAKGRQGELLPSPSSVSFSHFNRLL